MKTTKFNPKWKHVGNGANGSVYRISSSKCLKILDGGSHCWHDGFETKSELLDDGLRGARSELKNLKAAYKKKPGICPKAYAVRAVLMDGLYYPAIEMEFLDGYNDLDDVDVYDLVSRSLRKAKIKHSDLHGGNIMIKLTKDGLIFKVVDFG